MIGQHIIVQLDNDPTNPRVHQCFTVTEDKSEDMETHAHKQQLK